MRIETNDKPIATQTHHKAGLWKLLVAAAVILAGLIGAIEIFGTKDGDFASSHRGPTTIVK